MCQNFPPCGKRHYGECGTSQTPKPARRKKAPMPSDAELTGAGLEILNEPKKKPKKKLAGGFCESGGGMKGGVDFSLALPTRGARDAAITGVDKLLDTRAEAARELPLIAEMLARIESLEARVLQLEARKKYQRDLMRKRREEGKA